jgi:hypothetical protein
MAKIKTLAASLPGVSAQVLALRAELAQGAMRTVASLPLPGREVEILEGRDALWAIVRRSGKGGLAVRAAHLPGGATSIKRRRGDAGDTLRLDLESAIGTQTIIFSCSAPDLVVLRITVSLRPAVRLLVPFLPRDLYPLDENDDPLRAEGRVEAAQRGLNTGVSYFHIDRPAFGSVL